VQTEAGRSAMERYAIEKRIGTGSYGTAYLVHMKSDRCVCPLRPGVARYPHPIPPGPLPDGYGSPVAVHKLGYG